MAHFSQNWTVYKMQTSNVAQPSKIARFQPTSSGAPNCAHPRTSQKPLALLYTLSLSKKKTSLFTFPTHFNRSAHRETTESLHRVELRSELLWSLKNSSISKSYDQNKFSIVFLKGKRQILAIFYAKRVWFEFVPIYGNPLYL